MKALIISEDEKVYNPLNIALQKSGYDTIIYKWLLKALDNIEEIRPDCIVVSSSEYPRHWKTLVQFVKSGIGGENVNIYLYDPQPLNEEDKKKAEILGITDAFDNLEEESLLSIFKLDNYNEPAEKEITTNIVEEIPAEEEISTEITPTAEVTETASDEDSFFSIDNIFDFNENDSEQTTETQSENIEQPACENSVKIIEETNEPSITEESAIEVVEAETDTTDKIIAKEEPADEINTEVFDVESTEDEQISESIETESSEDDLIDVESIQLQQKEDIQNLNNSGWFIFTNPNTKKFISGRYMDYNGSTMSCSLFYSQDLDSLEQNTTVEYLTFFDGSKNKIAKACVNDIVKINDDNTMLVLKINKIYEEK